MILSERLLFLVCSLKLYRGPCEEMWVYLCFVCRRRSEFRQQKMMGRSLNDLVDANVLPPTHDTARSVLMIEALADAWVGMNA